MDSISIVTEVSGIKLTQLRLRRELELLDHRILRVEDALHVAAPVAEPPPRPPEPARAEAKPAPISPLPEPAPFVPPVQPPPPVTTAETESFELRFGQVWLVRIGIVVLLTGLVLLGNYAYHEFIGRLGPSGKIALLYAAAALLSALGWRLQEREAFRSYGRVLFGGGLAAVYYTTYAAHFVASLRVIESPIVSGFLLILLAGMFVWLADRVKSSLLAGATVALTFYTAAINPAGEFSLFSNLVISLAALVLLARQRWTTVSFLTLAGTYAAFAFWRVRHEGAPFAFSGAFLPAVLFPASYWLVHTAAVLWRRTPTFDPAARAVYLTINNAALFALAAPAVEFRHPGSLWICTLAYGGILLALSLLAGRRNPAEPSFDGSYLVQGLGLVFASLVYHITGPALPFAFALMSGTLLTISRLRHGGIFRIFAAIAAIVTSVSAVHQIANHEPHAHLVAGACAVILAADGLILRVRKGLLRQPSVDLEAAGFVGLATVLALLACAYGNLPGTGLRLFEIGIAAALSLRVVRLPELVYGGQFLALAGQIFFLATAVFENNPQPLWPVAASAVLVAWWQRRSLLAPAAVRAWQTLHLLAPVFVTLLWIHQAVSAPWQAAAYAGTALAVTVAGFVLRAWPVSFAAAVFDIAAFLALASGLSQRTEWMPQIAALAVIHAQSFAIAALGHRAPVKSSGFLITACRTLRGFVSGFAIWMTLAHVPEAWQLLSLTAAGAILLALSAFSKNREPAIHAAAFAGIGFATWLTGRLPYPPQALDYIAFALLIASGRFSSNSRLTWLPRWTASTLAVAGLGGAWILSHRLLTLSHGGMLVTTGWSLLAFATLGAGFAFRDRTYRLAGLVMLVAAILRIFLVDVWAMETIFRILSFLVLGIVLLMLSFLYNRHAAALRKWL